MSQITVQIEDNVRKNLRLIVAAEHMTMSDLVNEASKDFIKRYIEKQEMIKEE